MRPRLIAVDNEQGRLKGAELNRASMRPRLIAVDNARRARTGRHRDPALQ